MAGDEDLLEPEPPREAGHEVRDRPEFWTGKTIGLASLVVALVVGIFAILGAVGVFTGGSSRPIPVRLSVAGPTTASPASSFVRPAAPSDITRPGDLGTYAASRAFWATQPTVFSGALSVAFDDQFDIGQAELAVDDADLPLVESPGSLISTAPSLQGKPILVVGRVQSAIESTVDTASGTFGMQRPYDVELTGPRGKNRVYALIDGGEALAGGTVIYVPVVLVASGQATDGQQTAYLVGLSTADYAADWGGIGQPSVPSLVRQFQRSK